MENFDQFPGNTRELDGPSPRQPAPQTPPASPLAFQTSEKTDKLTGALAKAQGEIDVAIKDAENPHFKSSYADLASVWRACRIPLAKNGVLVIQWPIPASAPNKVALITRVAHEDQWMQSGLEMPVAKPDAQGVGTALTYLRRYMLSAVAGVAPDDDDLKDDDGNAASGKGNKGGQKPPVNPQGQKPQTPPQTQEPPKAGPTEKQLARLFTIAAEQKWTKDQVRLYMVTRWEIESTKDLTFDQYEALVTQIQRGPFSQARAMLIGQGLASSSMPEG